MRRFLRNPAVLAGGGLALLAGLAFVAMRVLSGWEGPAPAKQEAGTVRMGGLFVAAQDLPPRTVLTKDMLEPKRIPREAIAADAIRRRDQVLGYVTKTTIRRGWPIRLSQLAGHVSQLGLPALIPSGHRAMVVPIAPEPTFHNVLKPGDRIDVVVDFEDEYATIVLEDLLVLAVDHDTAGSKSRDAAPAKAPSRRRPPRSKEQEKQTARTDQTADQSATLAVTPDEAEKLALVNRGYGAGVRYTLRQAAEAQPSPSSTVR
jgi:pilus assembly protein CpaB